VSGGNLAYVIYTSGSSGKPKGVMITHEAISNHMQWLAESYPLGSGDRVLQKTPFSFDASVWEFYAPLLAGARLVLARPGGHQDSKYLVELMQQEQISIVQVVPSLMRLLLGEAGLANCGSLRRVFSGGERLTPELAAQFWQRLAGVELINLYGPTEATIDATHRRYEAGEQWEGIGRPVGNMKCYLLDEKMKVVPVGAVGELWLGGAGLARGYLQRAELTAQKFVPDQYSGSVGRRLYGTGDLGRYGSEGELEYVGRADGQLKVRGYRIEVGEIEQRLRQHEEVQEAVVVGKGTGGGVERLVGYVVMRPGSELQVEELRRHVAQELPDYMVPSGWLKLERLPLTASGKLDRLALPEPDHTRPELAKAYMPPSTPIEQLLVNIWSDVLGITQVGIHDNFFTLGGDSIRSIQVMALAREKGLGFSIQQVFEYQTIHELSQHLQITESGSGVAQTRTEAFSLISEEDRLALPAEVEDAYPLTSLQAGMLYHMELRPAGVPVYHNINSFQVRAQLNVPALQKAIQRVVDRHPIMRTGFDLTRYSQPLQLVHRSCLIEVREAEDLSRFSADEQQQVIARFMKQEYERGFDLVRPPLVRFSIHRRSAETFQYTLTECHAISDGWSTTSMFAEIFRYYFAQLNNDPIVEEPLPSFTFRDFINLEQAALASPECQKYWSEKLRDCAPTRLPRWAGANGQEREVTKHKFVGLVFRAELYEGLKRLAQLAEVPLKSVLLAMHMKVLSMSCAQPDVMTALATNGRPEEMGGDRVRGLFINMVPFTLRLSDCSWLELVKETFNSEREMLTYRRYPLAAIQKGSNKQRLLETAFNFVHFHSLENVVRSGKVELISSGTRDMADTSFTMNTSFTIGITSLTAPRLEMGLEYDGTELPEEQVKAIVDTYIQVMRAMSVDPYASHAQLNMTHLLSEEDHLLLDKATHIEEFAGSFAF
jgi:amino acid adenylation domain-containing protein